MKISIINFNPQIKFSAKSTSQPEISDAKLWNLENQDTFDRKYYPNIDSVDEEALDRASRPGIELNYRLMKIALIKAKLEGNTLLTALLRAPYQEAEIEMASTNLGLVKKVAATFYHYFGEEISYHDLFAAGKEGLEKAAPRFNPIKVIASDDTKKLSKKTKNSEKQIEYANFSTYATHWIKQVVRRYRDENRLIVRIPTDVLKELKDVSKARIQLQQEGIDPSDEMLAEKTGLSVERIRENRFIKQRELSLNKKLSNMEPEIGALVSAKTQAVDYEPRYNEAIARLEAKMANLSLAHATLIRHLIENGENLTDEELAKALRINSRDTARIREEALTALSAELAGDDLFGTYLPKNTRVTEKKPAEIITAFNSKDPFYKLKLYILRLAAVYNNEEVTEDKEHLLGVLQKLNDRERQIIIARYLNKDRKTLDELGNTLGAISRERVRQVETHALQKFDTILDKDDYYSDYTSEMPTSHFKNVKEAREFVELYLVPIYKSGDNTEEKKHLISALNKLSPTHKKRLLECYFKPAKPLTQVQFAKKYKLSVDTIHALFDNSLTCFGQIITSDEIFSKYIEQMKMKNSCGDKIKPEDKEKVIYFINNYLKTIYNSPKNTTEKKKLEDVLNLLKTRSKIIIEKRYLEPTPVSWRAITRQASDIRGCTRLVLTNNEDVALNQFYQILLMDEFFSDKIKKMNERAVKAKKK